MTNRYPIIFRRQLLNLYPIFNFSNKKMANNTFFFIWKYFVLPIFDFLVVDWAEHTVHLHFGANSNSTVDFLLERKTMTGNHAFSSQSCSFRWKTWSLGGALLIKNDLSYIFRYFFFPIFFENTFGITVWRNIFAKNRLVQHPFSGYQKSKDKRKKRRIPRKKVNQKRSINKPALNDNNRFVKRFITSFRFCRIRTSSFAPSQLAERERERAGVWSLRSIYIETPAHASFDLICICDCPSFGQCDGDQTHVCMYVCCKTLAASVALVSHTTIV